MNIGKCPESILKRSVLKQLNKRDKCVQCRPGVGKGAAVISGIFDESHAKDGCAVMHTEVFTGTVEEVAHVAVHASVTQLLIKGALPKALSVAVMLPADYGEKTAQADVFDE